MAWYLQWIGCAFGVCGALLLALNNRLSRWGFVAYLASNAAWIGFGILTEAMGLVAMQAAFTATSLLGIYRWMPVKAAAPVAESKNVLRDISDYSHEFRARKSRLSTDAKPARSNA